MENRALTSSPRQHLRYNRVIDFNVEQKEKCDLIVRRTIL
jgi:hypothetical protein